MNEISIGSHLALDSSLSLFTAGMASGRGAAATSDRAIRTSLLSTLVRTIPRPSPKYLSPTMGRSLRMGTVIGSKGLRTRRRPARFHPSTPARSSPRTPLPCSSAGSGPRGTGPRWADLRHRPWRPTAWPVWTIAWRMRSAASSGDALFLGVGVDVRGRHSDILSARIVPHVHEATIQVRLATGQGLPGAAPGEDPCPSCECLRRECDEGRRVPGGAGTRQGRFGTLSVRQCTAAPVPPQNTPLCTTRGPGPLFASRRPAANFP